MVLERLPPNDIEAEEAVLASLLVDSEAIVRVSGMLKPDDYPNADHLAKQRGGRSRSPGLSSFEGLRVKDRERGLDG